MGFWQAVGAFLGGAVGSAIGVAVGIAVGGFTAGRNIPASISSAKLTGPNSLDAGTEGGFKVEFTTSPGATPIFGITKGNYDVNIKWDPTDADPVTGLGGLATTTRTWNGVSSHQFAHRLTFDFDGYQYIEWEVLLVSGSGAVLDSRSGTHAVLIKQP